MSQNAEARFKYLLEKLRKSARISDLDLIKRAFEFAKLAHSGEKRISGEDFIIHPIETAINVLKWSVDEHVVAAALLHDSIEHGAATIKDVQDAFGPEVYGLVDGVTKVSKLKVRGSNKEVFVENLRKMFFAMAKDLRVILLRFAERLDNLRTIQYLPEDKRFRFAKESLEIYSPLAERLGMWDVKSKIDETSFMYAYPKEYARVKEMTVKYFIDAEKTVDTMISEVNSQLKRAGISANVYGRRKNLYSVYCKLQRPEIDWDIKKIHDYVALRVIVEKPEECYSALGVVHNTYRPAPQLSISDYIANPKPNGYQSIHTKVIAPSGNIAEIQFRTYEMHEQAEFGSSSHIVYTDAKTRGVKDEVLEKGSISAKGTKLAWVQQLARWQKEIKDTNEYLETVRFDALSSRIFAFTPGGDVYDLPKGATPVDFAFALHTGLGSYIKSAKVNGKSVPLDYKIQNGQVVEIEKTKSPRLPSRDWLHFVVTGTAKSEIRKKLRSNS